MLLYRGFEWKTCKIEHYMDAIDIHGSVRTHSIMMRARRIALKVSMVMIILLALHATITLFSLNHHANPSDYAVVVKAAQKQSYNHENKPEVTQNTMAARLSFKAALENVASPDGVVLVALIDWGFMDMALNFYETSLQPHGIKNYLFLTSDNKSCDYLANLDISCYMYVLDESGAQASEYQSKAFIRKMNYRTQIVIDALEWGFTVLHSDIDIIFLKNPFHYINCSASSAALKVPSRAAASLTTSTGCAVRALWDATKYNAGFLYVRPTNASLELYKTMRSIALKEPKKDDQVQMADALLKLKRRKVKINIERLDQEKFQCGRCYFEDVRRSFAGDLPCRHCVVVHNNWIVTMEAKRYRAREHLHWYYDAGQYYSNTNAKYMMYSNPTDCTAYWDPSEMNQREIRALQNALAYGHILQRIVILPAFHCHNHSDLLCPLNSFLKISAFEQPFGDKYREHSFLKHFKVPEFIKSSINKNQIHFVPGSKVEDWCIKSIEGKLVTVTDRKALSDVDVRQLFGSVDTPILHFYNMYETFSGFVSADEAKRFNKTIELGFVQTDYRQQKKPPKNVIPKNH